MSERTIFPGVSRCVVFLYGGKAFAVRPEDIVRIERGVSADKIVSSDDYEETAVK